MANASASKRWLEHIQDINPEAVVYAGYESCVVGICERFGLSPVVAYDYEKCIKVLMARDRMTRDEALEFFEFNTLGTWAGAHTPVFLHLDVNEIS